MSIEGWQHHSLALEDRYIPLHSVVDTRLPPSGPEHQEFQVTTLADAAELLESAAPVADGHTTSELADGAVVSDAFPHAPCVLFPPRVQGVVLQPADGHDRGLA